MARSVLLASLLCTSTDAWVASMWKVYSGESESHADGHLVDVGGPLFLTPLIDAGLLDKARQQSRVGRLLDDPKDAELFPSYAGFLTVDKEMSSNIFFWFFPAKVKRSATMRRVLVLRYHDVDFTCGISGHSFPIAIDATLPDH
ncbi:hypothetical protein MRX96_020956 [Rhipicephalus microplus]